MALMTQPFLIFSHSPCVSLFSHKVPLCNHWCVLSSKGIVLPKHITTLEFQRGKEFHALPTMEAHSGHVPKC